MVNALAVVDLVQRQMLDEFVGLTGGVHQSHGLLRRIDAHQRRLQLPGQQAAIDLAQQHGHVGVEGRVEEAGQFDGVEQLQPVERVHTQRGQRRLDEAQAGDDAQGDARLGRAAGDGGNGRLADVGVAGHGVEHVIVRRQTQHLSGDGLVDGGEVVGCVIDGVEAMEA